MLLFQASDSKVAAKEHMIGGKSVRPSTIEGTGFISEVCPRKQPNSKYIVVNCSVEYIMPGCIHMHLF